MNFDFIPQLVIVVSLIAVIVIIARRIPQTSEIREQDENKKIKAPGIFKNSILLVWDFIKKSVMKILGRMSSKVKEVKEKAQVAKEGSNEKELAKLAEDKPLAAETAPSATADEIIDLIEKASNYFGKGNYGKAEKIYIKIISIDPKNIRAYKGLGRIYKSQRNFKDAKASFEQVLKINSVDKEAKKEIDAIAELEK